MITRGIGTGLTVRPGGGGGGGKGEKGGYSPIKVTEVLVVPLKVLKAKMTTVRVDTLY